jgi:hypothetical protein
MMKPISQCSLVMAVITLASCAGGTSTTPTPVGDVPVGPHDSDHLRITCDK